MSKEEVLKLAIYDALKNSGSLLYMDHKMIQEGDYERLIRKVERVGKSQVVAETTFGIIALAFFLPNLLDGGPTMSIWKLLMHLTGLIAGVFVGVHSFRTRYKIKTCLAEIHNLLKDFRADDPQQ